MYSNFILFFLIYLVYLHIIDSLSCPDVNSIQQIDFIDNNNLQSYCHLKSPFIFEFLSFDPELFNSININTLMYNKFLKLNIYSIDNNKSTVINFNKAIPIFNKQKTNYFTFNNHTFIINNNIIPKFSQFHELTKPPLSTFTHYDIISGSHLTTTPLRYHSHNRSFIIVIQGKIHVKTISLSFKDDISIKFNETNLSYHSNTDIWNTKTKKIPILDFKMKKGYILFLPANLLYSIKFLEPNTLLWMVSYDSIITSSINYCNSLYNQLDTNFLF